MNIEEMNPEMNNEDDEYYEYEEDNLYDNKLGKKHESLEARDLQMARVVYTSDLLKKENKDTDVWNVVGLVGELPKQPKIIANTKFILPRFQGEMDEIFHLNPGDYAISFMYDRIPHSLFGDHKNVDIKVWVGCDSRSYSIYYQNFQLNPIIKSASSRFSIKPSDMNEHSNCTLKIRLFSQCQFRRIPISFKLELVREKKSSKYSIPISKKMTSRKGRSASHDEPLNPFIDPLHKSVDTKRRTNSV